MVETALELIWEKSYNTSGVAEISRAADVRPGSFYYFFDSKKDLALEALEYHWEWSKKELLEPIFNSDAPALDKISTLFEKIFEFHDKRKKGGKKVSGCLFGSFTGELGKEDEAIRKRIEGIFDELGEYFGKSVSEAVAAGELDISKADIPSLSKALVAYYEGILILARASDNADIVRELAPFAVSLVKRK